MFGFKHIKFDSMTYVLHYANGKLKREGKGLAFFYYEPISSIAAIPVGSNDLPFIFKEITKDYQDITIQGQISYKVKEPKILAEVLDFTIEKNQYKKNDIEKMNQRIINEAQASTSAYLHSLSLKEALRSAEKIKESIVEGLSKSEAITKLGIEIIGCNILAVQASPEMTRALETETREKLQQEADQAIFERRNFAVEQERKIKETELNTEIAVEEKQKQIEQKKMETRIKKEENERKLRELRIEADISVENQRKELIEQKIENERKEAEAQGYVLEEKLRPYKSVDWKVLMALTGGTDPQNNIALAFRQLAENADKIGTLNITPDLLNNLLENKRIRK